MVVSLHFAASAQQDLVKDTVLTALIPKDSVLINPAIPADFAGGQKAWGSYLIHNLRYPPDAMNSQMEGIVTVHFIVEKNGRLSKVFATGAAELLLDEGVRLIKESPRWVPAMQDGQKVRSYKDQTITFKLEH